MRLTSKKIVVAALSVGSLVGSATGALAYGGDSYGGGPYGGGSYGGGFKAVSYINSDGGKNADVTNPSNCFSPDQYDMQKFSSPASGNPGDSNVHNDACFLDGNGNKVGKNVGATFQTTGTGYISACPDPDKTATTNGPAFSVLRDLDGDGRNDSCFQSSYQEKGIAGDFEYHVRVNNTGMQGQEKVTWGQDSNGDGRVDNYYGDSIKVDWSATGTTGASYGW